jgi:hypothetical protein
MLPALDRKAFDARFVSDKYDYSSERDQQWLAERFCDYSATASWIQKHYRDEATRDRLMRYILPAKSWKDIKWDDDLDGLMTKEVEAVIEAAYTPADKLRPSQWVLAVEDSSKAVEDYLAAAPEFQNAKVDTFFIHFAVDTAVRDIKAEKLDAEKLPLFWFFVCVIVFIVFPNVLVHGFAFGLLWVALAYGWRWWALALCAVPTALCVVWWWPLWICHWIKLRRERRRLADALIGFESIRRDLYAESYDAATIERRLTELEREKAIKLPSYVFTLLNRRAAAHLADV